MASRKRTGHYVVSTHWDREWYQPLQEYRHRLVNLIDELLDVMKRKSEFRYFQTDGQAIVIEDYLEVRPEREAEIKALADEGRLRIGPWYVMPDEALVSGESLIRNLQMGIKVASQFGQPSRVGFACDIFGHISQLPQIFRGFSIDNALIWRGVNESTHGAMFNWQAPDGSEVITYRFSPLSGYCSYAFKVRHAQMPDEPFDFEATMKGLHELVKFETQRCPTTSFLIFDGGDHLEIEPHTPEILERGNQQLKNVELIHSHLDGFIEDLREQRKAISKTFVGELREPAELGDDTWLIPGVLSSRIPLKQANARCEAALCLWAEPFSTFAALLGQPYPHRYLELAWRYLIKNHPHDSICGCSIDQVHKDMAYRFDQCESIASVVTQQSLRFIADHVQIPELGEKEMAVVVFNPNADAIEAPIDLMLRFPSNLDAVYQEWFGFEPKLGFKLYDAAGKELPYQYVNQRRNRQSFRRPLRKFPAGESRHEIDISVPLEIPAYGYTTIICKPIKEPTRHLGSMAVDDHTIENEFLTISVDPNGTLTVTDKRTDETYDGLLTLEDRADIGDGWYHGTAVNDEIHTSVASAADVAIVADGIAKATLKIRVTLNVPERFEFGDLMKRADRFAPLVVTHYVTLRHNCDDVEVRTVVDNNVSDHRLRVLFPTHTNASTYLADQAFDVVERPIALRSDNARYKEPEVETKPQQSWTAVYDDDRGLAVVSTGLPESAVSDLPSRPIALTLLRGFMRTVMTSGEPGGQIPGTHEFRYRIVPFSEAPDVAHLTRLGQQLAAGVHSLQLESRDVADDRGDRRHLPPVHAFLKLDAADVVLTAVHQTDDNETATIRMYNPTDQTVKTRIQLDGADGEMTLTDFEGRQVETLRKARGRRTVTLDPRKIANIRVKS